MKYEKDYISTRNKEQFMKRLLDRNIKNSTATRAYYRHKQKYGLQDKYLYFYEEKHKPDSLKILRFNDIIKYGKEVNKEVLRRYGFTMAEIKWLDDEGYIEGRKFIKNFWEYFVFQGRNELEAKNI